MNNYNILTKSVVEKVYSVDAKDINEAIEKAKEEHIAELYENDINVQHIAQKQVFEINELVFDTDIYPYALDEDYEKFYQEEDLLGLY